MGRIIRLHDEDHWEMQSLLPWYVTGRLERAEHARVEAHVASCAECQKELEFERQLAAGVASLPVGADEGWRRMARRIRAETQNRPPPARTGLTRLAISPWTGWAAAACALVAVAVGVIAAPHQPAGRYHALGVASSTQPGNMVVVFRPEIAERDIRSALKGVNARIVDGPTGADAYVLAVPAVERAGALAKLRTVPNIVLAEPVDTAGAP